jgi:peptidoglycan/xylan/chitin deacetylase (PgdA/CDA1 family)
MVLFLVACSGEKDTLAVTAVMAQPTITATATLAPTPVPTKTTPAVIITSGDWTKPIVALTFDVCQDPEYPAGYDAALVAVLEQYNVPATFFMGGDWMRTHPDETKALAANPNFELGNHSWSHPDFTKLTEEEMAQQLETTEELLFELTGRHSRFFRPPFGFYNDLTLQVAAEHGLYTVEWDSVSGDPDPNFDAATILAEVQRTVRNGSIIIMHANGRGWHTAEALPSVIEYLQSKGYTLATLSQLLEIK